MQVKKFEARTMKDALEMVKTQLGPDAIILSARELNKSFGLGGQGSVEITAAVSEETMQKKKFVESRLRTEDRDRLTKAPARVQKQVIDKMVNRYIEDKTPKAAITQRKYADISDEEQMMEMGQYAGQADLAGERIKSAAQRAWNAMHVGQEWMTQRPAQPATRPAQSQPAQAARSQASNPQQAQPVQARPQASIVQQTQPAQPTQELNSLRTEVAHLKKVLSQFQQMPQSFSGTHPGHDYGLSYEFSAMFEKLTTAGVASEIAAEILLEAQKTMPAIKYKNKALVDAWVARYILDTTKVSDESQAAQVQIFMGPSGSGKTSSLVKLASHYVVNQGKKVAIVTTDTMKVGASDQMRIYAQILNVPFAVIRQARDWNYILQQLAGYDYILCDCPGLSLKNMEETAFLSNVLPRNLERVGMHLVLPVTSKDQDLTEIGRRYKTLGFRDVIFTCLDDSTQHGTIYNFMKRFNMPLHSFGLGARVPEDFELATRERVLDLIFKLTKMKKAEGM